jgi:uncharacterized protein (DUF779 family)
MATCEGLTPRARRLLERVRAAEGAVAEPLAFLISGGCCGGTNPVLCRLANVIESFDVRLGDAGGIGVFAHPDHARYLSRNRFLIDALDGAPGDTFSLEIPYGGRFVLRALPLSAADPPPSGAASG